MDLRFLLLFIVPFVIIIVAFLLSKKGEISFVIPHEANLSQYLEYLFQNKISLNQFQLLRIICSILLAVIIYESKNIILITGLFIGFYWLFYVLLKRMFISKLDKINDVFPYYLKALTILCYRNPVSNALAKSVQYADKYFSNQLEILVKDLNVNPDSYDPYQHFIDYFQGRIKNGDFYFRMLYQISNSSFEQSNRLITSLSKAASIEINQVRDKKINLLMIM